MFGGYGTDTNSISTIEMMVYMKNNNIIWGLGIWRSWEGFFSRWRGIGIIAGVETRILSDYEDGQKAKKEQRDGVSVITDVEHQ